MVSHSRIAITCFLLLPGFLLTWLGLAFIQPSDRTHATSRALRIHSPNERADETDHQSHDTDKSAVVRNAQSTTKQQQRAEFTLPARCVKDDQKSRRATVSRWCEDNGFGYQPPTKQTLKSYRNLQEIYVNDEYKTLYCHIPKTGCTNWKKYFILLSGKTSYTKIGQIKGSDAHSLLFSRNVRNLASYTDEQKLEILSTYFKFVIVRHPLTRLLSAYRNKFEKINPTFEFFTQKILSYNNHDVGRSSDLRPTFSEFLRFITDPEGVNIHLNEHWQSFHKLCHPCYINYDYIGHVETMTDDSKKIIEKIGADYVLPEITSSSDQYMTEAYSKISQNLTKRVISKYADDLEAFGYNC